MLAKEANKKLPMNGRTLSEVISPGFFQDRRILVDERLPQCCDFFLVDLVRCLNCSIFHYNNDSAHFTNLLRKLNLQTEISSIYDDEWRAADILDDVWVGRAVHGVYGQSKINVFRSNTATTSDYYDYDAVVRIEPLKSGCTGSIDGTVCIFSRDVVHYNLKYKIFPDCIHYYSH
jgi:hypothetical protein